MVPEIIIVQGEGVGRRRSLEGIEVLRIGRAPVNDFVVMGRGVSGFHCVLKHSQNVWSVLDMGGANGTLVNGHRIQEHRLQPGDLIQIGETILRFRVGRAESASRSRSPQEAETPPLAEDAVGDQVTEVLTPVRPAPSPLPSPSSPTKGQEPSADLATPRPAVPTPMATASTDIPMAIPVAEAVEEPLKTPLPLKRPGPSRSGPQVSFDAVPVVIWLMLLAGAISIGLFLVFVLRLTPWRTSLAVEHAWLLLLVPCAVLVGLPFWLVAVAALELAVLDAAAQSLKKVSIPIPRLECPQAVVWLQCGLGLLAALAGAVAFFVLAGHSFVMGALMIPLAVVVALETLFPAGLMVTVRRLVDPSVPHQEVLARGNEHLASALSAVGSGLRYGGIALVWLVFVIAFPLMVWGSLPLSEVLAVLGTVSVVVVPVALGAPFMDLRGIKGGTTSVRSS